MCGRSQARAQAAREGGGKWETHPELLAIDRKHIERLDGVEDAAVDLAEEGVEVLLGDGVGELGEVEVEVTVVVVVGEGPGGGELAGGRGRTGHCTCRVHGGEQGGCAARETLFPIRELRREPGG